MVNKMNILGAICLLGIYNSVTTAEEYIPDSYDIVGENYSAPRPYKRSPVKKVVVIENGMKSEAENGCLTTAPNSR